LQQHTAALSTASVLAKRFLTALLDWLVTSGNELTMNRLTPAEDFDFEKGVEKASFGKFLQLS
jgi:hypothetical protein